MEQEPFSSPSASDQQVTEGHHTPAHNPPLTPEEAGSPQEEAKAAAMSIEVRQLDGAEYEAAPEGDDAPPSTANAAEPMAVAQGLHLADFVVPPSGRFRKGEWEHEFSGHKLAAELARIEAELKRILEDRDPKRKRKLGGPARLRELEEDIVAMKFAGRMDEDQLRNLSHLIIQYHFLFDQLRFVASTRSTWNT